MYHIAVEARLTGPATGAEAALRMIADYAVNEPESLRRNEAHICLVDALKRIIWDGSEGVAGATTISGRHDKGATVSARDMLNKEALRTLARLARSILDATGCTLDVLITQVMGQGPYTVDKVSSFTTICPKQPKGFHILTQKVISVPTLGLEG